MDEQAKALLKYVHEEIGKCQVLIDSTSGRDFLVAKGQLDVLTDMASRIIRLFGNKE